MMRRKQVGRFQISLQCKLPVVCTTVTEVLVHRCSDLVGKKGFQNKKQFENTPGKMFEFP